MDGLSRIRENDSLPFLSGFSGRGGIARCAGASLALRSMSLQARQCVWRTMVCDLLRRLTPLKVRLELAFRREYRDQVPKMFEAGHDSHYRDRAGVPVRVSSLRRARPATAGGGRDARGVEHGRQGHGTIGESRAIA